MNDYIKREDAVKIINSLPWTSSADHTRKKNLILLFTLYGAADAVEVVRCKDCKWFNNIGCAIKIVDDSDKPKDNDYCSFGERADK